MVKSIYIHIPFCKTICSYCDFCKMYYDDKLINKYLDSLEKEIKSKYKNEVIETLYIGGGTPSILNIDELKRLFKIIKSFNLSKNIEFTFECNIDIEEEKLKLLYKNRVNRLSFGIQTFNKKHLKFLNRNHTKEEVFEKVKEAKNIGFNNINIDLIYAIPGETIKDLENDLNLFLSLNIEHISCYSLIIEKNTILYNKNIKNIDQDLDYKMYELINKKLEKYNHYEISNYSIKGYESKHNLTYWNNLEYYGFGLSSSGYIDNIRYDNTRSINDYVNGKYVLDSHKLDINETIENEFILGFRKIKGINKKDFYNKYKLNVNDNVNIKKLIKNNKLIDENEYIFVNPKFIYVENSILEEFIN